MVFGYSTNAYVNYSVQESLARIAALGFRGVEIMCDRPHLYPPDFDDGAQADLKSVLDTHRLHVTNLNSFTLFAVGDTYLPSWIEPEAERRAIRVKHTLECLQVARALGAGNISVPPGGPLEKNMTRQEAFRHFFDGLEQILYGGVLLNREGNQVDHRCNRLTAYNLGSEYSAVVFSQTSFILILRAPGIIGNCVVTSLKPVLTAYPAARAALSVKPVPPA